MKTDRNLLATLIAKTQGKCAYCGLELHWFEKPWEVEHMQPKGQDGSDEETNLVAACHTCNACKRNRTPEQYREKLLSEFYQHLVDASYVLDKFCLHPAIYQLLTCLLADACNSMHRYSARFYFELSDEERKERDNPRFWPSPNEDELYNDDQEA